MALVAAINVRPSVAAPADVFQISAPVLGPAPPKAADIKVGDASVSTQTGALQFSVPIEVPPGRNGMKPSLSLAYSSSAPTFGGVAAGWSLAIPEIREDTSAGRLRSHSRQVEAFE